MEKSTLKKTETTLNYTEIYTMMARVANKINDRPLGIKKLTESNIVPLTVNQLLIGRTDCHEDHKEEVVEAYCPFVGSRIEKDTRT